jgi:hypothetical protein
VMQTGVAEDQIELAFGETHGVEIGLGEPHRQPPGPEPSETILTLGRLWRRASKCPVRSFPVAWRMNSQHRRWISAQAAGAGSSRVWRLRWPSASSRENTLL